MVLTELRRTALPVSSAVRPDDSPAAASIISAAVVAMAENGYHGTSVRDIADLARVSSAVLYHYFQSKHGLLQLIMLRGIEHLHAMTEAALLAAPANPPDRLRAIVGVHVSLHLNAQREAFIGNTELRSLEPTAREMVTSRRDLQQRLFDQVVDDGVAKGLFLTPYPREASRALVTMSSAVSGWYNPRGALTKEEVTARYQELGLSLVGYRPRPKRRRSATEEP
jgi:AcrR family transcriptional regulator